MAAQSGGTHTTADAKVALEELRSVRVRVDDMICNGCRGKVHRALSMLRGVTSVEVRGHPLAHAAFALALMRRRRGTTA